MIDINTHKNNLILSLSSKNFQNDEFYLRCLDCSLIPEITLNYNDNTDDNKDKIQIVYKCEDYHKGIIPINDFLMNSTNYNIYKAVCAKNNNHQQKDRTSFIYCIECEKFYCPECHLEHKNEHNKFCKINEFDYQCKVHNKSYSKYCFDCSKNICEECLNEHLNHKIKNINNKINIEKYTDIIKKAQEYNSNVNQLVNSYIKYIQYTLKKLIINLENFKDLNNLEINLCNRLIKIAEENNDNQNLNYHIINNLNLILNFNEFNINKIEIDKNKINEIEYVISHSNSFLTNFNNFILKSSIFNSSISNLKIINENKEDNNFILAGIKLFDNRIGFSFTNSNINIYDNNLKKNITIKLSEDEYCLCLYQLLNEQLLVGTNLGNIYCFILKNDKYEEKGKFSITEKRIFKILKHPNIEKLLIVIEGNEIKILNINNFEIDNKNIIKDNKIKKISNAIINNNKLILFSSPEKIIKFWKYSEKENIFKIENNEFSFSCVDWLEGVIIIDKERILVLGNEKLLLININNYQNKESYLNEQFISLYYIGNNSILIGGNNKIIQGFINEDNNIYINKNNIEINEGNLITKFIDLENGKFVIGSKKGKIFKFDYKIK